MTKAQAMAMNHRFLSMDSTIKAYDEAYKFKYFQLHQARQTMVFQDSIIDSLSKQVLKKSKLEALKHQDLFMAVYFVLFSTTVLYLNFK